MLVRQKWTLTQEAFDKLLIALGGDRESGSEKFSKSETTSHASSRGAVVPFPKITPTIQL